MNVTKAREHLSISPKQTPAPGLTQSNSGGTNIQQSTTGPNSPNIAGNDNQVNYADTSELPILSQSQLAEITKQMSSFKYKLIIHFNMSDREATVLANDLVVALKAAGWDANYLAGMGGGGIQNSVPIVMGVKNQDRPALEAGALQGALKTALGFPIPGIIDNTLPDNEVDIALISHPVRRPK